MSAPSAGVKRDLATADDALYPRAFSNISGGWASEQGREHANGGRGGDGRPGSIRGASARLGAAMGWQLSDGRNKFFGTRGMDQIHSFWWHYLGRIGSDEALRARDDPANAPALTWTPQRSNCPELETLITETLDRLQPTIRDVLEGIFVGRTIDADVNAEAFHENGRAYVVLPIQYTHAAEAYLAAWDRFGAAGREKRTSDADLAGVIRVLDDSRDGWAARGAIFPATAEARSGPTGPGARDYGPAITAVERWIVAHEWAHHLLGHQAKSVKSLHLEEKVTSIIDIAGHIELVLQVPEVQRREMHADILATMLLAGGLDKNVTPRPQDIFLTVIGGAIALIAEGHVHESWSSAADDTHPGAIRRLNFLLQFAGDVYGAASLQRDGASGDVEGLCASLATFANFIAQASAARRAPERFAPANWERAVEIGRSRRVGLVAWRTPPPSLTAAEPSSL